MLKARWFTCCVDTSSHEPQFVVSSDHASKELALPRVIDVDAVNSVKSPEEDELVSTTAKTSPLAEAPASIPPPVEGKSLERLVLGDDSNREFNLKSVSKGAYNDKPAKGSDRERGRRSPQESNREFERGAPKESKLEFERAAIQESKLEFERAPNREPQRKFEDFKGLEAKKSEVASIDEGKASSSSSSSLSSSSSVVEAISGGEPEVQISSSVTPWSADAEQIAQQVKADNEARGIVQLQRSIVHLSALQKEIEELLTEEQLFKAQFAADALQRLVKQHAATALALESPEAKVLANRFMAIGKDFTKTSTYQTLEKRMQSLQRVIKVFSLESRFDVSAFEEVADPDLSFNAHRSRGFSIASIDWVSSPAPSLPITTGNNLHPLVEQADTTTKPVSSFRSATRNFFRLASRAGSSTRGPRPGEPRKSRFRIRKRKPRSASSAKIDSDRKWDGAHECKGMAWKHTVLPDGSIAVSLRAKLRLPLFRILAILNETDYYNRWVPYCKECKNLGQISRSSMVLQQISEYPWPIKMKETVCYTQGIDALDEFGCVILCAANLSASESSNPDGYLGVQIPPVQKKVPRIPSGDILFLLSPIESGACTIVELFASVDTGIGSSTLRNVLIPVLKTVVIKTVRGFLHKIGVLATNFENNGYADKVKQNSAIYEWISGRINEGVATGIFPPNASMATLNFEELSK